MRERRVILSGERKEGEKEEVGKGEGGKKGGMWEEENRERGNGKRYRNVNGEEM